MALAPILCENCSHRITPSMSIHDVDGKVFCENCFNKRTKPAVVSTNPCVDSDITVMNQYLEKAGWQLSFKPGMERDPLWSQDSWFWWNKRSGKDGGGVIETFDDSRWQLWTCVATKWQPDCGGRGLGSFQLNWPSIHLTYSPK